MISPTTIKAKKSLDIETKRILKTYLFLTFVMAWGFELFIILGERIGLLDGNLGKLVVFIIIGFGAGMSPAYATYILLIRHKKIKTPKQFVEFVLHTQNMKSTVTLLLLFMVLHTIACIILEQYLGQPWYLSILYLPLMVIGGGFEEIGWRGILQPILDKKLPLAISRLLQGIIWGVWHIPLWFIENSNQSNMNFLSFLLYCIAFGFMLGELYRLSKSVIACVLLHAWGNVIFGGMFTINLLTGTINVKVILVYLFQFTILGVIALSSSKH